jgi:hypothetical protein
MSVARFAFQACLIDCSSISPFRINDLQSQLNRRNLNCDTPPNLPRSLTGIFSIAGPDRPRSSTRALDTTDARWHQEGHLGASRFNSSNQ